MSDCVAICEQPLYSSFPLSAYISLTIPIVSKSRSRIEMPSCTQRSRNNGVVIWRSVGRSFFRRNIGLHIQSPQLDDLRHMHVFCVFHDPAVLYSFLSFFLLNKADFFHYSIRCQQSPLPEHCQKSFGVFPVTKCQQFFNHFFQKMGKKNRTHRFLYTLHLQISY